MPIAEARTILFDAEMERRLEDIDFSKEAKDAVESNGIVFLDEIDKVSTAVRVCVCVRVKWGQEEQEGALCINTRSPIHARRTHYTSVYTYPNILSFPCLSSFLRTPAPPPPLPPLTPPPPTPTSPLLKRS